LNIKSFYPVGFCSINRGSRFLCMVS